MLIYTASGDSEGKFGGLIEREDPEKLYPVFIWVIGRMVDCSSDPNCSEGQFKYQLEQHVIPAHTFRKPLVSGKSIAGSSFAYKY